MKNIFFYTLILSSLLLSIKGYTQTTIYVDIDASGNNTGENWENAFVDLQLAIAASEYGDEIWIAKGTYYPTTTLERNIYFAPKNGTRLYGGFAGGETSVTARNWLENETVLSGDLGEQLVSEDNSYTIVYLENCDSTTLIDGVTISDAYGDGEDDTLEVVGGGIHITGSDMIMLTDPALKNISFVRNRAQNGGAIYYAPNNVNMNIDSCYFENNGASGFGSAAIVFQSQFIGITPKLMNSKFSQTSGRLSTVRINSHDAESCIISGNYFLSGDDESATTALYIGNVNTTNLLIDSCEFIGEQRGISLIDTQEEVSFVHIKDCSFKEGNTAVASGIGIYAHLLNDNCLIEKSTFVDNNVGYGQLNTGNELAKGGAIFVDRFDVSQGQMSNTIDVVGCYFVGNSADHGGAIYAQSSNVRVMNNIFEQNFSRRLGGALFIGKELEVDSYLLPLYVGIYNNTFVNNFANGNGSVLYSPYMNEFNSVDNDLYFTNSILKENNTRGWLIWKNEATESIDTLFYENHSDIAITSTTLTANNNLVDKVEQNSWIVDIVDEGLGIVSDIYTTDNILDTTFVLNEGFQPDCSSLAIDAGSTAWIGLDLLTKPDYYGRQRIVGAGVDIGVVEYGSFELLATDEKEVNCFGEENGSVNFDVLSGCSPFTYEWEKDGDTGTDTTSLSAGSYQFTITDASGQSITTTINIISPTQIQPSIVVEDVSLNTAQDGSISIENVEGGVAPYTYLWSTGDTTAVIEGLAAGEYIVTIVDANECNEIIELQVDNMVGVKEVSNLTHYNISPNPVLVDEEIRIANLEGFSINATVEVYDIQGRKINVNTYQQKDIIINGLRRPGMYWVKVYEGGEAAYLKVVVCNR